MTDENKEQPAPESAPAPAPAPSPPPASSTQDRFRRFRSIINRPIAVLFVTLFLVFIVGAISVNDIMLALLHSREEVIVPNIEKKGILDALKEVSDMKLSLIQDGSEFDETLPAGTILRQHPLSGMKVRAGRPIRVVVSKGGQVVFVPHVIDRPVAEAQSLLATEGLQIGGIDEIYSPDHSQGLVISQDPSSGTVVTRGALVDLAISKGPPPQGAPLALDFVGESVERVRRWAEEMGLRVKVTEDPKAAGQAGTVVKQFPEMDQPVVKGIVYITIVPLLASELGFRFSYRVPEGSGDVKVTIKARSGRGEFEVYTGDHTEGEVIEVPMDVQSTTRVRIYHDDELYEEKVVEP